MTNLDPKIRAMLQNRVSLSNLARAAWLLALLVLGVFVARLGLEKNYAIDEFQYAHAAWLISKGEQPYRDFWEMHFPAIYQAFSPIFLVAGDDPGAVRYLRGAMLFVVAAMCLGLHSIVKSLTGSLNFAFLAPVLALLILPFMEMATEIRPDSFGFAWFSAALALAARETLHRRRTGFLIGAFSMIALWSTAKAAIYGIVIPVALLIDFSRRRERLLLHDPIGVIVGGSVVAAAILAYLLWTSNVSHWYYWTVEWIRDVHQKEYPPFSAWQYLFPFVLTYFWVLLLAVAGFVSTLRGLWRKGWEAVSDPALLLCMALISSLLSHTLQIAPFGYSLIPFYGLLCVFSAIGAKVAFQRALTLTPKKPNVALSVVWLLCLALVYEVSLGAYRLNQRARRSNTYQHEVFDLVSRLTSADDRLYDSSGSYVARPHAYFFYYTDAVIRKTRRAELISEIPAAIVATETKGLLWDARFKELPEELQLFFTENFRPYNGDLWFWGKRYDMRVNIPPELPSFRAIETGRYFIHPPAVAQGGGLQVDGAPVTETIFSLTRGEHRISYKGGATDFSILWLPRDGLTYVPRPELEPRFSTIF